MRKTMKAAAVAMIAVASVLTMSAGVASAQAAQNGCPPGQPSGQAPGTPPGAAVETGRPNYPPGRCAFGLSQNAARRGDTVTATGEGFVPGETVVLSIAGVRAGSVVAGADGAFSTSLTVPAAAPIGPTQVLAAGQNQRLTAAFEVLGAGAAPGDNTGSGTLPRTGLETLSLTVGAIALLGVGTVLVVGVRRRRAATS